MFEVNQLDLCALAHIRGRRPRMRFEPKQFGDLLERKTEFLGSFDESKADDGVRCVVAVPGRTSIRRFDESFALIETDRIDAETGALATSPIFMFVVSFRRRR